ncbi:MAG: orotidine-5'-phosphate decarboxylase [Gemmatimonadetes bacterium]|nr:orotidine-5'-phosphate decarboxylase [Gemmatimonadota bacterium]
MTAIPIVALDVHTMERARSMVRTLGDACSWYKVGLELFVAEGPHVVTWLREEGKDVFLDLKLHDIPNTVRGAARAAAAVGARLLTVQASGGTAMLEAAVEGAGSQDGFHCGVLAVTVLTSLTSRELGAAWGREVPSVGDEVLRLAGMARSAGTHGIVCSGLEAAAVRDAHGSALAVLVPGVRAARGPTHDQARVVTPGDAARAGARYVVLGRMVTAAADPAEAFALACTELGA